METKPIRATAEPDTTLPKLYLSGDQLYADSFRLARQIIASEWEPDLLLVLWRGGAPVGITIHEYFVHRGRRPAHHVVTGRSYVGLTPGAELKLTIAAETMAAIKAAHKVLIIDDIFDSGRTAMTLKGVVAATGAAVRIATLYWKPENNLTDGAPDYYLYTTAQWVVFPHELEGLSPDEIAAKPPTIAAALQ